MIVLFKFLLGGLILALSISILEGASQEIEILTGIVWLGMAIWIVSTLNE